ncbi:protein FAR1-RELATED SEQUENCE 5-like [Telopea speciosissima]|uniref:protein FAR1-RELATED SEQUENCE 5-like n=1 Tax=Telopea speciosissima TaxID=54955 RepID=UPI001CC6F3D2|nr:protein FAR1-RELATED SEQUENCE 5-like [Telopea speciosissima]
MDIPIDTSDNDIGLDDENKPKIGMQFNSENEAFEFYNSYGGVLGFSVRREYANRSKKDRSIITSRRFVCNKQGNRKVDNRAHVRINILRAETRSDCPARMGIKMLENGKYQCHDLIENHNHELHISSTTHMMRSQRKVSDIHAIEIDLGDDSGIKTKAMFEYMSKQAGGRQNLGYIPVDHYNYLRSKRQRDLRPGEAGSLFQYFEKQSSLNPSFTYRLQLDIDEKITNIFWADVRMLIDYALFGDVMTFDTTFCTNKEHRPFGMFSGFNHHRGVVIFGAALLYDETAESFKWLFDAFLKSHGQKHPGTLFTDQDAAMAKAILEVFPGTWHGLCTWHLMQNGIKHLGHLMKDGSSFLSDLKRCIYHYDEEVQFETAWEQLRSQYQVENGSWLDRIYVLKHKWAKCYMKNTFTGGMRSTQLSESVNAGLKDYTKSTLDIIQFFKHFERVVNDKRANELKVEFDARNKLPRNSFPQTPIMIHASEVYTPLIFGLFHNENVRVGSCYIIQKDESNSLHKYAIGILDSDMTFKVECDPSKSIIECSCKKFETFGILCCHALKIMDRLDMKSIPEAYILSRWTRAARSIVVEDSKGTQVEEDVNLNSAQRYRILCHKLVKIASQASNSKEGFALVNNVASDLCKQLHSLENHDTRAHQDESTEEPNLNIAKGLKKKEKKKGCGSSKRKKSCLETKGNKNKKKKNEPNTTSTSLPALTPCNVVHLNQLDGTRESEINHSYMDPIMSQGSLEQSMHTICSSQTSTAQAHEQNSHQGETLSTHHGKSTALLRSQFILGGGV